MDCYLLASMDANGAVGAGLVIASIKYSAELVDDSLLGNPGILLCSGGNSNVSEMHSGLVFLTYTIWHLY